MVNPIKAVTYSVTCRKNPKYDFIGNILKIFVVMLIEIKNTLRAGYHKKDQAKQRLNLATIFKGRWSKRRAVIEKYLQSHNFDFIGRQHCYVNTRTNYHCFSSSRINYRSFCAVDDSPEKNQGDGLVLLYGEKWTALNKYIFRYDIIRPEGMALSKGGNIFIGGRFRIKILMYSLSQQDWLQGVQLREKNTAYAVCLICTKK